MWKAKSRKLLVVLLAFILCVPCVQALNMIRDTNNPNMYRVVGLGYYDIWRDSNKVWQGNKPGDIVYFDWNQSFTMSRNIKKVTVRDVNMSSYDDKVLWNNSREKDDSFDKRAGEVSIDKIVQGSEPVINGKTVAITAHLKATLTAYEGPCILPTNGLSPNVRGERYYVPLVIEIELYPDTKTVNVQHFNANTGQRLAENDVKQVAPNTSYSASAKDFSPDQFLNVKISYDNGVSWVETLTLDGSQSTLTINKYKFCIPIKD